MRLLNPASVVQAAIPSIFNNVPQSFLSEMMKVFESNAKTSYCLLQGARTQASHACWSNMYLMVIVNELPVKVISMKFWACHTHHIMMD